MEKLVNSEIDLDSLARKAKLNRKSNSETFSKKDTPFIINFIRFWTSLYKKYDNKSLPLKRPENSIGSSPKTSFNTPSSSTSPDSPAPKKKRRRTLAERQQFFKSKKNSENTQYLVPADENTAVAKLSESMEQSLDLSAERTVKKTSEDKKFYENISLKKVTVVNYFNKSSSKTEFFSN